VSRERTINDRRTILLGKSTRTFANVKKIGYEVFIRPHLQKEKGGVQGVNKNQVNSSTQQQQQQQQHRGHGHRDIKNERPVKMDSRDPRSNKVMPAKEIPPPQKSRHESHRSSSGRSNNPPVKPGKLFVFN